MRAGIAWLAMAMAPAAFGQTAAEVASFPLPHAAVQAWIANNGKLAVALCEDGKALVWSLAGRRLARTIDSGDSDISMALLSDDGVSLLLADHTGRVRVWNTSTGGLQAQLKMWPYVYTGAFSPDGKRVALGRANEPVEIFETASLKKLSELQRTVGGGSALAFSRDGSRIAAGDADTVVRVYSVPDGELLSRNTDFLMEPLGIAFTPDGKQVVAGGGDKTLDFINASNGSRISASGRLPDVVMVVDYSADGERLAVALMNSANLLKPAPLLIFDKAGRKTSEWTPPDLVLGFAWTPEGHLMAATSTADALHLWRVE